MSSELPGARVPDASRPIAARGDEASTVWTNLRLDAVSGLMSEEPAHLGVILARLRVPHKNLCILVGGDHVLGILPNTDAPNGHDPVGHELRDAVRRGQVPDLDVAILIPGNELCLVWVEGD
eukprot:CAMPEP_0182510384 /NCGR_PEP_ID=MMETSP1321-20130603/28560_1 /TAXON_ID=91990 /ORGANISM="Bolidomonas sp., Strain RCC1657" /LENGTH=121 /DNA_ID=CAMNT_0024716829 /DNA_START=664 /DNA_END=1030 /DNA_ORIENTATION=+